MKFVTKDQYADPETNLEPHFILYAEIDWRILVFGNCDIWVGKKGVGLSTLLKRETYYDYNGKKNVFMNEKGNDQDLRLKRIVVLQFKKM